MTPGRFRLSLALSFLAASVAIVAVWAFLGRPQEMPASKIGHGAKLACVSYAPLGPDQTPFDPTATISPEQVARDLDQLSKISSCIRTYASNSNGHGIIPEIARRYGLTVMQGIWLGADMAANRVEIDAGIRLANEHPDTITSLIVGNEVLLRGDLPYTVLSEIIGDVKRRTKVAVTYADVWGFWKDFKPLIYSVDFVTIHILPYWEDEPMPPETAGEHLVAIHKRMTDLFDGKEVFIGEVGWPSAGRMRDVALPSIVNQARVLHQVVAAAERAGIKINIIEAYDQPWKRILEGTVGGYWGLFDSHTREAKFQWGAPASDHPDWATWALIGVGFAALSLGAAWVSGRGIERRIDQRVIVFLTVNAALSGILNGLTIEILQQGASGTAGLARALVLGTSLVAGVIGSVALVRGVAIPRLFEMMSLGALRRMTLAEALVGGLLMATIVGSLQAAICLAIDPRYLEFPFTAVTAAVVPLLSVVLRRSQGLTRVGLAECVSAVLLVCCSIVILWNEGINNWQAQWLVAAFAGLVVILVRGPIALALGREAQSPVPTR